MYRTRCSITRARLPYAGTIPMAIPTISSPYATLVGLQFAPRIPDLKHRRLHSFAKPSAYPALEPMIAGRINVELIRAHWSEILRLIASIRTGTVTALLSMRQGRPAQRVGKQWRIETVPRSSGCNRSSSVTFLVCRLMRTRRPLR